MNKYVNIRIIISNINIIICRLFFTEKIKRAQKVQATQTDGVRAVSPVTPHKVKTVSQKSATKKHAPPHESPKSIIR